MAPTTRTSGSLLAKLAPLWMLFCSVGIVNAADPAGLQSERVLAQQILDESDVQGGLIVHLGCGDGRLTAALQSGSRYLVHGLDADPLNVAKARENIRSLRLYGKVSAGTFDGKRLPYTDSLVNLLVAKSLGDLPIGEVMRVLVPGGVAFVDGKKIVKPWPADIDEWTHFLHDASNNAVAADTRVGPPRRLQWTAGPTWCRSHEFISSFCAMVSAGGRVFYVVDEAQAGVTEPGLPERWKLIARDAFNGMLLWKRPLPKWRADEWKNTSMRGRPASVPRRIVADGRRLYFTFSHADGLCVLDPATGKTLRTLEDTEGTQEIALAGRTLVLRLATGTLRGKSGGSIAAMDADTGRLRWRVPADQFMPQSMAAANGRVVYSTNNETVCLDLNDGTELWREGGSRSADKRSRERTFVLHDDLVLEGDGSKVLARDAMTGKIVWTAKSGGASMRGHDLFVTGGCAWHAAQGGIAGYDLTTGKATKIIDPSSVQSRGHHLRCYRSKATERFLITQFRGAEFVSLEDGDHYGHDWIRGPCRHGVVPCNGMLYAPPHQCFCYSGAMTNGLNAFTTASDDELLAVVSRPAADRLRRGPAFGKILPSPTSGNPPSQDWPMYRCDASRSGATACKVPTRLEKSWRVDLAGPLTPPVAAGGRVYVAAREQHTLYALRAADGDRLWHYTAGARIDSPPTVYQDRVLFGSADGWVYCLRASDGALAWRFRAAPQERLIMAEGQLESAWRVHGSVLVHNHTVYCTAGRSTFLDAGIYVYGLDPATGEVRHQTRLDTLQTGLANAVTKKPYLPAFYVEGTRSDLLVTDGEFLYLGQIKLDADLVKQPAPFVSVDDKETVGMDISRAPYVYPGVFKSTYDDYAATEVLRGPMGTRKLGRHVFSTGGFLDDSWFHRTFWMHSETWPGFQIANLSAKAGQLLVVDEATTYAVQGFPARFKLSPRFIPGDKGYLLLADDNENEPVLDHRTAHRDKGMGFTRAAPPKWHRWVPVRIGAMVAAGDTLFAAGSPDVVDPDAPWATFDGQKGAVLLALSKADGRTLMERKLDVLPVFDGMIAAYGRLYLSTINGELLCFGDR